jgi:transposase
MGQRRRYSREFKLEAVTLAKQPGISVKQAARELDIGETLLRRWLREASADPANAFPGRGQPKSRIIKK